MDYESSSERLREYRDQIRSVREKMREVQSTREPQPVDDYRLGLPESVRLSEPFGAHDRCSSSTT